MILCVGTTPVMQRTMVFDRLVIDEVNRSAAVHEHASGKSLNVARVAHLLGEDVTATGFLGGERGGQVRQDLNLLEINHDFVTVTPNTRMCISVVDQSTGAVTELVEESRQVELDAWDALRSRVVDLSARAKVMVVSGSLTPSAPQDFYAWCVTRANELKIPAIVDASGGPLKQSLMSRPFVVKPNRGELARTLGITIESETALRDAVKRLIDLGPRWAIITEGKAGAIVSNGATFWRIRSPQVTAVNAIGSGDALAGGLAVAIARGEPMPHACKLAIACGAANAMTLYSGVIRAEDVANLLTQVQLEDD